MAKALHAGGCVHLEQIPIIGPAMAADLRLLGMERPEQLRGRDAFALYQQFCALSAQRHDPCVLDTLMAAVDSMGGAPARPWRYCTGQRKRIHGPV